MTDQRAPESKSTIEQRAREAAAADPSEKTVEWYAALLRRERRMALAELERKIELIPAYRIEARARQVASRLGLSIASPDPILDALKAERALALDDAERALRERAKMLSKDIAVAYETSNCADTITQLREATDAH